MRKLLEWFVIVIALAFVAFGLYGVVFPAEQPMDREKRKTMLEAQAAFAAHQAKVKYVTYALRRTELPDNDFLDHAREDVQSLGKDLLQCWRDLDEAGKKKK